MNYAHRMSLYHRSAPLGRTLPRARRGLGDSPPVAMPNGQPTPPSANVAEAQAALGYWFSKTGVSSGLSPDWSQSDVDGVYGARTLAALKAMQTFQNGNGNTTDDVDASDGSLTTAAANEAASPFDTLNFLRSYVALSIAPAGLPYTFWGVAIQPVGTPVVVSAVPTPGPVPAPVPGPPGPPGPAPAPPGASATVNGMSTGMEVALAAVAVGTLGLVAYMVHVNQKKTPAAAARRTVRRTVRRAAHA